MKKRFDSLVDSQLKCFFQTFMLKCYLFNFKSFRTSGQLYGHKLHHIQSRSYVCDQCGKSFNNGPNLRQHKKIHITERNYVCSVCSKAFKSSFILKDHMLRHSGMYCEVTLTEPTTNWLFIHVYWSQQTVGSLLLRFCILNSSNCFQVIGSCFIPKPYTMTNFGFAYKYLLKTTFFGVDY